MGKKQGVKGMGDFLNKGANRNPKSQREILDKEKKITPFSKGWLICEFG